MFQKASKTAFFTIDLHTWRGNGHAPVEVLLRSEAAAATKMYLTVIKDKLGKRMHLQVSDRETQALAKCGCRLLSLLPAFAAFSCVISTHSARISSII